MLSDCLDATRVLVLSYVNQDTYAIHEDGEVSLVNRETLTLLLQQILGR